MIYINFICCNLCFSKFTPLEDEIHLQGQIYPRLRTTGLWYRRRYGSGKGRNSLSKIEIVPLCYLNVFFDVIDRKEIVASIP